LGLGFETFLKPSTIMYGDGPKPDESAEEASGWVGSYVEATVFSS
jgi:hypothetical protein